MAGIPRDWRQWPPALRSSVILGMIGAAFLVMGFVSRSTPLLVVATSVGTWSLISALVWRSQLIEAWRKEHGRPTRDW